MDIFKQTDLKQLTNISGEWCISIYMPAHRVGREQQQDPIRFRNLVSQANEKLIEYGMRVPDIQTLLAPAEMLLTDHGFWQQQSDGLAVFLSPGANWTYRLPVSFDELIVISRNFHIKPLLPLLNGNGQYYVLALSLDKVRLFLGTRERLVEMDMANVPTSMEAALWMDDPEKHLAAHSTNSSGREGPHQAMFHGQGANIDVEKTNILRFFQYLDRGLNDLLPVRDIPMLLAGVGYLLPIYHEANNYPDLLEKGLEGNPDEWSAEKIHQRAWAYIEQYFNEDQRRGVNQLHELLGQGSKRATLDLQTIVQASSYGQVETLFLPAGVRIWGTYDPKHNKVVPEPEPTLQNQDLLDYAAAQTILNSGNVFTILPDQLPQGGMPAAILRYAV